MYDLEILAVYQKCGITSFPIDCDKILKCYGYDIKNYIQASGSAQELRALRSYSTDAFTDHVHKIIYYNDAVTVNRIRFSKMHELGHIVLKTDSDKEADDFASNILAPRPVIYFKKMKNAQTISNFFDISITAANNIVLNMHWFILSEDGQRIVTHFGVDIDRSLYKINPSLHTVTNPYLLGKKRSVHDDESEADRWDNEIMRMSQWKNI